MHWALVAHKDQKDINLSSLRMLLVADGSNPCKVTLSRAHSLQRGVLERESAGGNGETLLGREETGSRYGSGARRAVNDNLALLHRYKVQTVQ